MKNTVREMIKDVIEENAVSFKETTSRVLLNKVGNVLSEKYVEISQQIFTEENADPHGGGLLPPPTQSVSKDTPSAMNQTSPYESQNNTTNRGYNANDPFWSTNQGRVWMTYFNYWRTNRNNPNAWNSTNPSMPQFASANALIEYLSNQAQKAGVTPPTPPAS
jgi:hypothetical protein